MTRASWWLCGLLVACAGQEPTTTADSSEVQIDNGLSTNGLIQNGIFQNGIFQNGIFQNGIFQNGIFQNGIFQNGIFQNGIFQNGIFQNGIFQNGIFQNALWQTDLAAREMLRTNPATRKVLQYIYECAMTADQSATLDPGDGTLVVLRGAIGLAPWWGEEGGTCDVSCQRWVSACVLARTNAYGLPVKISMRVPSTAPEHVRNALRVDDAEASQYKLREGAYYGNLFATTTQTDGVVVSSPSFYACAGPGSNIPDITKRFCSSQGDNGIIEVPGVCEPRVAGGPAACDAREDATGAFPTCYTSTDRAVGERYDEVITVYLEEPIAVCGNTICEPGEATSCPSDCIAGGWARSFAGLITGSWANPSFMHGPNANHTMNDFFATTSDVASDGTIVVGGLTDDTVDLGGGALPATPTTQGLVAKFAADGTHLWSRRFGVGTDNNMSGGVAVDDAGNIVMAGNSADGTWVQKFSPAGLSVWTFTTSAVGTNRPMHVAAAPGGDIVVAGTFSGTITFGAITLTSAGSAQEVFVAKLDASGTVRWAVRYVASYPTTLAVSAAGDVAFGVARNRGPDGSSSSAIGLVKLASADGDAEWENTGHHWSVAFDASGDVYASGALADPDQSPDFTIDVGYRFPLPLGTDRGDFFIAKYAGADGAPLSVFATVPPCRGTIPLGICQNRFDGRRIAFDAAGNLIVGIVGGNGHAIDFGTGAFNMSGTWDTYIASFTPSLQLRWVKHVPMILDGTLRGLDTNAQGQIIVSGSYSGSMIVDSHLLVNSLPELRGSGNAFLAAITPPPAEDETAPVLALVSDDIVVEATGPEGAIGWYVPPVVIDDANAGAAVGCFPAPSSMFPLGSTPVTCTGSDPAGNLRTVTFDVKVVDLTGPAFTAIDAPVVEATGPGGATVTFPTPLANDRVDGLRPVSCTHASGAGYPIGTTQVVCTASDLAGNASSTGFSVIVRDTTPPAISAPAPIETFARSPAGAVVNYATSAFDVVDGAVPVACTWPSGSTFPIGTTTVQCTVHDTRGNFAVARFTVFVAIPWSGVLEPINADGSSTFKLGRTIPIKLQLTGGAASITDAVITLSLTKVSSTITGTQEESITAASADSGTTFRYDPTANQYIFNLATQGLSVGTWRLGITMPDGLTHSVLISLRS